MSDAKKKANYLDNEKFSAAVIAYVEFRKVEVDAGREIPQMPNYIGSCFWSIATGLTYNKKFIANHAIRDELIDFAVENCIRAIHNFNPAAATRSGKVNAFGYFTMVCYNALLRRCMLEAHQKHIRNEIIDRLAYDSFVDIGPEGDPTEAIQLLEQLRVNRDNYRAGKVTTKREAEELVPLDRMDWTRVGAENRRRTRK